MNATATTSSVVAVDRIGLDEDSLRVLPPPSDGPAGQRRLWMRVAHEGALPYAHGTYAVDAVTMSDPAWLDSLRGAPVVLQDWHRMDDNPDGSRGLRLDELPDASVGTVTRVEYVERDEGLNPPGPATWAEVTLSNRAGIDVLERIRGVSPGYTYSIEDASVLTPEQQSRYGDVDGVQRNRRANHVALVTTPRGERAGIRATDSDDSGDTVEIKDLIAALMSAMASEDMMGKFRQASADGYKMAMDEMKAAEAEVEEEDVDAKAAADAADRLAFAQDYAAALDVAREAGVDDLDGTPSDIRRRAAKALGITVAADASDDFVAGVLAARAPRVAGVDGLTLPASAPTSDAGLTGGIPTAWKE